MLTLHCGPHDSLIPIRDLFREYFSSFVTSFTAPGASGWSAVASRDLHPKKLNAFQGIHNNLVENAKKKLKEKGLDLIVANDESSFNSDSIKFSLIGKNGQVDDLPQRSKEQAAHLILDKVVECSQK